MIKMVTKAEILDKYGRKLRAKAPVISANWEAAKERMIKGYDATPFNTARKDAYETMVRAAKHRVDIEKAIRNYEAKMF